MRLDKFLTACGVGTRSEVKKIIRSGLVSINEEIIKAADYKVNPNDDVVNVSGRTVFYEEYSYYLFHKPAGCVTANDDESHKTIMEYLPSEVKKKCAAVGRLDKDTEGLLLLTNDGALSHYLRSPAHHISKTYFVRVDNEIPKDAIEKFKAGIDIGDDKLTLPAELKLFENPLEAELTITEGRYHQVKRMFWTLGCKVIYLKRLSMGPLTLDGLEIEQYRKLSPVEVEELKNFTK